MAKKPYPAQLEKQTIELIHHLEEEKVPSAHHILQEHKHLVHHEDELKALLQPIQLAPVQNLGTWKSGASTVEEIPRIPEPSGAKTRQSKTKAKKSKK